MHPEDCEACWQWNDDDSPCHHQVPRKPHLFRRSRYRKPWFVTHRTYTTTARSAFPTFAQAADYARGWTPLGGCR